MAVLEPDHSTSPRDPLREALHGMWSSAAGSWTQHASFVDARGEPVTTAMLDLASPLTGKRVLELACGPGGVGLAASARVGPEGQVVLSDVAVEMVAAAAARADRLGLSNVVARVLDLEHVDEPDAAFDVVLCREGLMLVPEPVIAAGEIHRVLAPGGRAAIAVWGPRDRNPWLGALFDALSSRTGAPIPPPGIPGPFSLDAVETIAGVLERAGFTDVEVHEVAVPFVCGSFDEWWTVVPSLAGPIARVLAALPAEVVDAVRTQAREALVPFATTPGYTIPGLSLVAAARRGSPRVGSGRL